MHIISQFDNSAPGNDCYLYSLWQLANVLGKVRYIHYTRYSFADEIEITCRSLDEMNDCGFQHIVKKLGEKA